MNVGSGNGYPASALSNFSVHPFVLDGVKCTSMEGFLQSLKFESIDMQKHICTLAGLGAKRAGSNKKWYRKQLLYWNGKTYARKGINYQNLLNRAYNAMYKDCEGFRKALEASGNSNLTHTIGKTDQAKTVLTIQEFVSRLTLLRDGGLLPELVKETDEFIEDQGNKILF